MFSRIFNIHVPPRTVDPHMAETMLEFFDSENNTSRAHISNGAVSNLCRTIVEQNATIQKFLK